MISFIFNSGQGRVCFFVSTFLKYHLAVFFSHELNKNKKIPFLDNLTGTTATNNNDNFTISTYKKHKQLLYPQL